MASNHVFFPNSRIFFVPWGRTTISIPVPWLDLVERDASPGRTDDPGPDATPDLTLPRRRPGILVVAADGTSGAAPTRPRD